MTERTTCRVSGELLVPLFSLGDLYVSDFLPAGEESKNESKVPLALALAPTSGLVQLTHTAPSDAMYRRYWYRSGTNATMKAALKDIVEKVQMHLRPTVSDVWVDIGTNDGTLLSFVDTRLTRIGFDPARNTFMEAESKKHADEIVVDYFTYDNYHKSVAKGTRAKVVTSIAMFYDLEDPNTFVADVARIMHDEGLWVIQMSYLPLMLAQLAFDNICHEHLEYYSLASLTYLLDRHDLAIVDVEMNDVNGGSFRVYVRKNTATAERFATAPYRDVAAMRVAQMRAYETTLNLADPHTYLTFFKTIEKLKAETVAFIKAEKAKGKLVWGYGASTKGNTLLQWYGLNHTLIDAIAERAPMKFGHRTVGTDIPIVSEAKMRTAKPDYLLVLPWHFIHEFRERESAYLKSGGHFIVPCPRFEIIGP
jgi:hypothetical protein